MRETRTEERRQAVNQGILSIASQNYMSFQYEFLLTTIAEI